MLNLIIQQYSYPYNASRIKKGPVIQVIKSYKVSLSIGRFYKHEFTYDTIEKGICYAVLGMPWMQVLYQNFETFWVFIFGIRNYITTVTGLHLHYGIRPSVLFYTRVGFAITVSQELLIQFSLCFHLATGLYNLNLISCGLQLGSQVIHIGIQKIVCHLWKYHLIQILF